jgi:hypothetical protein
MVGLQIKIKGDEKFSLYTSQFFTTKDPLTPFGIPDLSHIIK